jgi:hypothetical protein
MDAAARYQRRPLAEEGQMKKIERLTAMDVWLPEPTVSERAKKRQIMPRDRHASDTPSSRQLVSRAYQDAFFIEAMPSNLRGMLSLFAMGMLGSALLTGYGLSITVNRILRLSQRAGLDWSSATDVAVTIFAVIMILFLLIGGIRALRIDLTVPKENPIVFNRKTRKVYRYTPDVPGIALLANDKGNFSLWGLLKYIAMTFLPWPGMLLVEYDWDCIEAEYYSQTGPSGNVIRTQEHLNLFVRERPGSDKVIGSFPLALSFMVGGEALAKDLWEHVRRFMEEGGPALSPGDKPAPSPPRTAWQAACAGPLGRSWVYYFVGAVWTTPEFFYFFMAGMFGQHIFSEPMLESLRRFPEPDMTYWWMLYPWWNQTLADFFFIIKAGLALFLFYPVTAMTFFAVLASKLSPAAKLPEDLAADAGPRLDLNALAGAQSTDMPTQPAA